MRVCENCGTKMPFGRRRSREKDGGRLLCNGCDPDGKGPGEGRPVGHHGAAGRGWSGQRPDRAVVQVSPSAEGGWRVDRWSTPRGGMSDGWSTTTDFEGTVSELESEGYIGDFYSTGSRRMASIDLHCDRPGCDIHFSRLDGTDTACPKCGTTDEVHLAESNAIWAKVAASLSAEQQRAINGAAAQTGDERGRLYPGSPYEGDDGNLARPATIKALLSKGLIEVAYSTNPTTDLVGRDFGRSFTTRHVPSQSAYRLTDEGWAAVTGTTAKLASGRDPIRMWAMQYTAHDSGDGETIYHCPFCGGGSVTGRSDGTVECGFCQNAFTVQIQPVHPGAPQTINGQPVEWPGQPEGTFQPEREAQPGAETGMPPAPEEGGAPPATEEPAQAPGGGPPPERKNKVPPQFANASFVTQAGHVLDAEAYMRHLAILHADDPQEVLAEVRAERR